MEKEEIKKTSKLKKIIITILIILILLGIYMVFIGTHGFIVKEYAVYSDSLPDSFNGFKIVHLSDIHYGSMSKEKLISIVNEVNNIKPDMIVFTGDLYDEYSVLTDDNKSDLKEVLNKLEANFGKFAISGNHDYSFEGYEQLIEDCGFTYLNS